MRDTPPTIRRSILDLPDESPGLASEHPKTQTPGDLADTPAILEAVRDVLLAGLSGADRRFLDPFAPPGERNARVIEILRAAIGEHRRRGDLLARLPDDADTLLQLFAATLGWGPAQPYLDDPNVNEVKINGCTIMVQEAGRPFVAVSEHFTSPSEARSRAMQLASLLGVQLDARHPQETLPVAYGTRVHVTIHPRLAHEDEALICIRRGRQRGWDLNDLLEHGAADAEVLALLALLCRAGCSFLIAGRTGSGKTVLLEALANSWPDDPHIISIEDHSLEICVRATGSWTRELVDTQRDPHAFGRAAREALRQTPGLLLPGEIRGHEAGAILSLALSDHAVITTLHARTAAETISRFAGYAAQPGAYMFEGRYDDALRETCAAFDVVVRLDVIPALGRRVIADITLIGGSSMVRGVIQPLLTPLVALEIAGDGAVSWRTFARATEDGLLHWRDEDQTPPHLRERLERVRTYSRIRSATTLTLMHEALVRADTLLAIGSAERALSVLRGAWHTRRDERIRRMALRAIEQAPQRFAELQTAAAAQQRLIEQHLRARRWNEAQAAYRTLMADVATAALASEREETLDWQIRTGVERDQAASVACADAEHALAQNDPRAALDIINPFVVLEARLSDSVVQRLLLVREAALGDLLDRGEGSQDALLLVRERRMALEQHCEDVYA